MLLKTSAVFNKSKTLPVSHDFRIWNKLDSFQAKKLTLDHVEVTVLISFTSTVVLKVFIFVAMIT